MMRQLGYLKISFKNILDINVHCCTLVKGMICMIEKAVIAKKSWPEETKKIRIIKFAGVWNDIDADRLIRYINEGRKDFSINNRK